MPGGRIRAHYFQHVPFEGIGSIGRWLDASGRTATCTRFYEHDALPELESVDLLIVVGGPMSANDERDLPWLAKEKAFIREAVLCGKPVLGICLGAQLMASALGARVYKNGEKEIGWFNVHGTPQGGSHLFAFPPAFEAFHWHGETFDLPEGAVRMAGNECCENQAFQIGKAAIGLQFHLEATPESVAQLVANCRGELVPGKYIQSEAMILSTHPDKCSAINACMDDVLSYLTGNAT